MSNYYITKTTRKVLSRRTAKKAFGKSPSNYQIGQAGKAIDQVIHADPKKFIEFHEKFMRPKEAEIVEAAAEVLNPQETLF